MAMKGFGHLFTDRCGILDGAGRILAFTMLESRASTTLNKQHFRYLRDWEDEK
jgi:hypothetical protein